MSSQASLRSEYMARWLETVLVRHLDIYSRYSPKSKPTIRHSIVMSPESDIFGAKATMAAKSFPEAGYGHTNDPSNRLPLSPERFQGAVGFILPLSVRKPTALITCVNSAHYLSERRSARFICAKERSAALA